MVVGHLRGVEHSFAFGQRFAAQRSHQFGINLYASHLRLEESVHHLRTFRVDVVAQVLRVHTWIGGQLPLIECLYGVQRHLGAHAELSVAVHLQRRQVVELFGSLFAVFLLHLRHGERLVLNPFEALFAFLLAGEFSLRSRKQRVSVDSREHPVGFRFEVVNLFLAVHDECQCGCLHPSDAQHLLVLSVLQCVQSCGVHAQNPVADGPRKACQIERLIVLLVFQLLETLADGLVGHRRYPQSFHRAFRLCLLHHPPLNQLTFLSGVAAVDDAVGLLHQLLNHGKLFLDALILYQFDAEAGRNHRQCAQRPPFPLWRIVVGFFQRAQVSERPRHLIAVAFHIAVVRAVRSQYAGDVFRHTRFLCNTYNHGAKVIIIIENGALRMENSCP